MKRSIFFRIFTASIALIVVLAVAYLAATFAVARTSFMRSMEDHLRTLAVTIDSQIAPALAAGRADEVQSILTALEPRIQRRITVIRFDGSVLADSENDPRTMENHANRPEVRAALAGNIGSAARFSTTVHGQMLYVAVPFPASASHKAAYIVRVSMFMRDFNAFMHQLHAHLIQYGLIILLVTLAGAIVLSRALARPLKDLQSAAETMAKGDLSARVQIRSSREIMALGAAFNQMAERIHSLFADLHTRTEELNTILAAVPEPLFVVAKDGMLLHANDCFTALFAGTPWAGRYYWEVFRAQEFESLIKNAMRNNGLTGGSLAYAGHSYLCSISRIPGREEYVVILNDMTEERKLQTIKKDFVSNVSHELRTPLTAIKGFVETLEDMVSGEGTRYLGIIKRHTDRLIHIVEDLLLLSEVENPLFKLDIKPASIPAMIGDIITILQPRIKQKDLQIIVNAPASLSPAMIDPFRLEQALINLVDNAIKYTDAGEICITAREEADKTIISVSDTGAGIPADMVGRIFERFFVVDPSRSRTLGGTGLGLSIVKHIVTLHGGTIDVVSAPGKGSTFTMTIPMPLSSSVPPPLIS